MKNFRQEGDVLTLPAPYAVASGGGMLVGALFAVAVTAADAGASVAAVTVGVFDLAKAESQAWTIGAKVYWDNTARVCTTVAAGNTLIGAAVAAVGGGATETIGRVRLNGTVV